MLKKIFDKDRVIAEVRIKNKKLDILDFDGGWVVRLLQELKEDPESLSGLLSDKQLFDVLEKKLQGNIWASVVND